MKISYSEFKQLIKALSESVDKRAYPSENTLKIYFDKYFKYYEKTFLEKIFLNLIENSTDFGGPKQWLDEIKMYGYPVGLHKEVESARTIIKTAKKQNIKIRKDSYPVLGFGYPLPLAEAWKIAYNELLDE